MFTCVFTCLRTPIWMATILSCSIDIFQVGYSKCDGTDKFLVAHLKVDESREV